MATAEEYAAWIVKNADKKGTPEFETVAQAYQLAKRPKAPIVDNLNAETLDPTKGMSMGGKLLAGIGQGMRSVYDGVTFANKADVDARKKTDEALLNTGAGTVGSVLGNMAAAAPAAFIPGANTILGAGAIGAGVGALTTPGDFQDRATGAAFGGAGGAAGQAIPRVLKVVGAAAEPLTEGGRQAIIGRVMNRAAGDNAPDVANRLRLAQALVPGSAPTAAEVAESGGIAALQRAMSAADPEAYAHRGAQQASARLTALDAIAPRAGSVPEAAQNFGNLYDATVPVLEKAAGRRVSAAFDGIDPFGEVQIQLPIDAMRAARDKFLGPGTFGTGGKAAEALKEAERIGLENVTVGAPKGSRALPQTLAQAVRKAGGIKADGTGDLASLTNKGSGSSGLVRRDGLPSDLMAEEMAARGFIKNADPDALVQALEGGFRGRGAIANDTPDSAFEAMRAAIQGGGDGGQVPKALPFQAVQNFRSSLGEAAQQARLAGNKQEAAALRQMATEIENKIASVAEGGGNWGEAFGPDQVLRWREALKLHADKMQKFHTGPQKAGFRTGGDGQPVTQGGEWAPKFFNSTGAQRADMQSFQRVAGDQKDLVDALKSYAMTDAAGNKSALTDAAFRNWRGGKSQALAELLSNQELAALDRVGADLARKTMADNLGRGPGSNTFQNFAMDNLAQQMGMPSAVKALAGAIPGLSPSATLVARGAGAAGRAAYSRADDAIRQAMAQALLNPQEAATLMEAASRPQGLARLLSSLPPASAERLLPVIQAMPGVAGSAALPTYFEK